VTDLVSLGCCGCLVCGGSVMRWTTRGDCLARERAVDVCRCEYRGGLESMAMGAVVFLPA
jgi:hypothetical protein